jgi:hypothetical protein
MLVSVFVGRLPDSPCHALLLAAQKPGACFLVHSNALSRSHAAHPPVDVRRLVLVWPHGQAVPLQ